ncbi:MULTISPECIES: hypothetical protein [unclassified Sphingopyxis]|uniref:hypothetical protein n=1 Tax=unclassified Sphingopyxis TaxID=2614943 RepID=UPI000736717C|nr:MULTISPECIES: hypothetical protein [unclassified Sphingopyxis]KTE36433.1 hypothetical protein ATE62_14660 [Sphingopyxis sp. HIX]
MNRYIWSLAVVVMISGCSGPPDSAVDFQTDEPAKRIASDILTRNDLVARAGLVKNHLASMESESLTFCNNDAEDRTIKARIFSEFGDNMTSGREMHFCVTKHGDIRKIGEQAVDMARPDRFITWADIGGTPVAMAPAPAPAPFAAPAETELVEGDVGPYPEPLPKVDPQGPRNWQELMKEEDKKVEEFQRRVKAEAADEAVLPDE